jgi:hypothetical protein
LEGVEMIYLSENGWVLKTLESGDDDGVKREVINKDREGVTGVRRYWSAYWDCKKGSGKDGLVRPIGGKEVWLIMEKVVLNKFGSELTQLSLDQKGWLKLREFGVVLPFWGSNGPHGRRGVGPKDSSLSGVRVAWLKGCIMVKGGSDSGPYRLGRMVPGSKLLCFFFEKVFKTFLFCDQRAGNIVIHVPLVREHEWIMDRGVAVWIEVMRERHI